ncbi:MAG: hypothetical protein PHC50_02175 [Candidatus Cloacimonetes bacterium]|nr:hypothetical protein [Candidatus Cloacimonadota bacterium]
MARSSKRAVRGISILIVFLALAATIMQMQKKESKSRGFSYKESQNEYRDLKYINKASISLNTTDSDQALKAIDEIITANAKRTIRREVSGGNGAFLFTVKQSDLSQLNQKLGELGSIGAYVEQVDTSLVNLDYEGEHKRLLSYEQEQTTLSGVRFPSEQQNRRKEALHTLIQQSRINLEKLKESENVLLYIALSSVRVHTNIFSLVKIWLITYVKWLGILTLAAIIVYFGTRLLMYILSLLGIRGVSLKNMGPYDYSGSYYSKYDGYSSSYGRNRRKTKRIYKDKSDSSPKEE